MSIMSMRRKMASKQTATIILWVLIAVFLVGIALWSVPQGGRGIKPGQTADPYGGEKVVVATVNGDPIYASEMNLGFTRKEGGAPVGIDEVLNERRVVFDELMRTRVRQQAIASMKIRDIKRVASDIAHDYAKQQIVQLRKDVTASVAQQNAAATTPAAKAKVPTFDQEYAKQRAELMGKIIGKPAPANVTDDMLTRAFLSSILSGNEAFIDHVKLRQIGQRVIDMQQGLANPFTEEYVKKIATQEVKAKWIYIMAKDQTPEGLKEAETKAIAFHDAIASGKATFEQKAKEAPVPENFLLTLPKSGDLGWMKSGTETPAQFSVNAEYLAFAQKPNELGPVTMITCLNAYMTTYSKVGYGFVQVLGVRPRADLPKDFDWTRDRDMAMVQLKQRYQMEFGESYMFYLAAMAKVETFSSEIAAYVEDLHNRTANAGKLYEKFLDEELSSPAAKAMDPKVLAAIQYNVAMSQTKDMKKRAALLEKSALYADDLVGVNIKLGQTYETLGDKTKALESYKAAAEAAPPSDEASFKRLKDIFKHLGATAEVKQMEQALKAVDANKANSSSQTLNLGQQ